MLIYAFIEIDYIPVPPSGDGSTGTTDPSTSQNRKQQNRHYYREPSAQIQDADPNEQDDELHHKELTTHRSTSRQRTPASNRARSSKEIPQHPAPIHGHALFALFGTELDTYVAQHMDKYDSDKAKWASCTKEEWVKGADGMVLFSCLFGDDAEELQSLTPSSVFRPIAFIVLQNWQRNMLAS
jgi:hypothetical protein